MTPLQQPGEGGGSGGGERGDSEEGPGPDNIEEGPGPDNIGEWWYNNRNGAKVCNCY